VAQTQLLEMALLALLVVVAVAVVAQTLLVQQVVQVVAEYLVAVAVGQAIQRVQQQVAQVVRAWQAVAVVVLVVTLHLPGQAVMAVTVLAYMEQHIQVALAHQVQEQTAQVAVEQVLLAMGAVLQELLVALVV
jgi:hypothetical protein